VATLIDSSLWIDFTRLRSPRFLKDFIAPHVLASGVVVAEPVMFEVLRYVSLREAQQIQVQFRALPVLATPADLWNRAAELGQDCRKSGINAGALDLIIAQVAIHHAAELVTFDAGFQAIASASALQVILLQRPTS
jgi:predicted nucleic acid-binding protein